MARIPEDFIQSVLARTDIVDVIDARVPLQKRGRSIVACCPFHTEKTPSFTVNADKQFYYCFGCGAGGSVIGFLMAHDHLSYVETIEYLAAQLGLEVPRENTGTQTGKPANFSIDYYALLDKVRQFYQQQLPKQSEALAYLKKRGLSDAIIKHYGVGFAPPAWEALLQHFGKQAEEKLFKMGLCLQKEGGSHYYDRFRNRVMFPIRDKQGRVIGFGGRVLDDSQPKYMNSPETPLFHKGRELYGLYEALQANRVLNHLIVVEGYMDVIALAQYEISNTVATLGTALTAQHIQKLFRQVPEVILCFDGDRAGREAAWRAAQVSLPHLEDGRQLKFIFLPDGEDPDSCVRKEGKEAFVARVQQAAPFSKFLWDHLIQDIDMGQAEGRAKLVRQATPLLLQLPQGTLREILADQLAQYARLDPFRLKETIFIQFGEQKRRKGVDLRHETLSIVEKAISLLLHHPELIDNIETGEWLTADGNERMTLLATLWEWLRDHPGVSTSVILEQWRERSEFPVIVKLAAVSSLLSKDASKAEFIPIINKLRQESRNQQLEALMLKARMAGLSGLSQEERLLIQQFLSVE